MKCRPVRVWMLSDESPQRPSPPVRRHLQHCPRCRRRYGRVVRLIHETQQQPLPDTTAAQARFLQGLSAPSVPAVVGSPQLLARRRPWTRWLQAAMLLVGFGLGWAALSLFQHRNRPEPSKPIAQSPRPKEQRQLENQILEQHLKLAEAQEPTEQVQALGKMATDLKTESLRQARKGAADDVAFLVWLYRRVVGEGVVRSAGSLAAEDRAVLTPVIADLEETGTEAGELARTAAPPLAVPLRLLVQTARAAARALKKPQEVALLDPVSAQPPVEMGSRALLKVMVVQSLLVVAEDDPVRRAGHSTQVAHGLAQAILDRAGTADEEEASHLGQSLGAIMDRAVNPNLEQLDPKDGAPRQKEAEAVRQRAGAAFAAVREKLPDMPQAARGALQRVIEKKRPPRPKKPPKQAKPKPGKPPKQNQRGRR